MITKEEQGRELAQILRDSGFSQKQVSRQKFLPLGITLDGRKCRITEKAGYAQELVLNFEEAMEKYVFPKEEGKETLGDKPEGSLPEILYEDAFLLAVNKPSGLSCHPGRGHYQENLGTQVQEYCRKKGEACPIRPIGRLDKDTSGVMLFAKDRVTAARLWEQRKKGLLKKTYQGAVHGEPEKGEGVIDTPIGKMPGEKNRMLCQARGEIPEGMAPKALEETRFLPAVTHYRVSGRGMWEGCPVTLVECVLETGRTHQIRVHFSSMGHPLFGDRIYGISDLAPRLCLHAAQLSFFHPYTGEKISVEAPADEVFKRIKNHGNEQ